MARKLALLIGVSEYDEGFEPLSAPPKDVAALQRVLENRDLGGFDKVSSLINPSPTEMRMEIEQLFSNSMREDLLLLFFSGHGITDDNFHLYLTTRLSSQKSFRATSVDARFIQDLSDETYARRQVIILDCCYSGAFSEGWQRKGNAKVQLEQELGKQGRVVLTSSSSTQVSFQQKNTDLSLYTQYLVEGIETGAADLDQDGVVKVRELHSYAQRKVQEVKPRMKPAIIVVGDEGYDILLSKVKIDAKPRFQPLIEECVNRNPFVPGQDDFSEYFEYPELEGFKSFDFEVIQIDLKGNEIYKCSRSAPYVEQKIGNKETLELVYTPGGNLIIEPPDEEEHGVGDEYPKQVNINPFLISKFTITQEQYTAVVGYNPSSKYRKESFVDPKKPVVGVSWEDAVNFCTVLSQKTGYEYRLPSEAEWEYACRAGSRTPFCFGSTISTDIANYDGNYVYKLGQKGVYRKKTIRVGSLRFANAFGLYDCHGNVWEWCLDHWHENYKDIPRDGKPWITRNFNSPRLLRGGSWRNEPNLCRSSFRYSGKLNSQFNDIGFRVVRFIKP